MLLRSLSPALSHIRHAIKNPNFSLRNLGSFVLKPCKSLGLRPEISWRKSTKRRKHKYVEDMRAPETKSRSAGRFAPAARAQPLGMTFMSTLSVLFYGKVGNQVTRVHNRVEARTKEYCT
jgi:hypothetical protein